VIAEPPSFFGGTKVTTAPPLLRVALTAVVSPGTVTAGVTGEEVLDELPVPLPLVAATEKVYAVPLLKPGTVIGEDVPVAVTDEPPPTGVAVTV
jgi:hypothetical protein